MLRFVSLLCTIFFLFSCKKEVTLDFSDRAFSSEKNTIVSIIIPEAKGNTSVAKNINTALEHFACDALAIDASKEPQSLIDDCIKQFDESYTGFKEQISNELSQELPLWEANIDGEVTYQNENLISIAMNSSINTGSAKSNLKIKFFNFEPSTGKIIATKDIINNFDEFKELVKKYYNKELLTGYHNIKPLAENAPFNLPKSLGFSDDGVIIFYNSYELLMPSAETIEFTIPYQIANDYLTF